MKLRIAALIVLLGLIFAVAFPGTVAAATPTVKLVLGGTGATSWNIGNIKPGDSGTQPITVLNNGTGVGDLTIWVSNVVNTEGTDAKFQPSPDSGDLGAYLTFTIVSSRISSNIAMPSLVNSLPQSAGDSHYIKVLSLAAGETISINWNWNLPAGTGNIVQGDGLSYTINYMLEELPPIPSPTPIPPDAPKAILGVSIKKTGPSDVSTGLTRSYTLTVTNTGETALNDVTVTDYLPELLIYQNSIPTGTVTGNQIAWNLGTLNKEATKDIVVILYGAKAGITVNTATVTTREGVSATDSLTIAVVDAPGVLMSLSDSSDPVIVCDVFTYTIKVLNQSTVNSLHNITVTGLLPYELVYIGADGPTTFTVAGQEVRFGPVAELKPGDTIEFHIKVQAVAAGAAVFKATLKWDEFSESIVGQESTIIILPESSADQVKFVSPNGTVTQDVLSYRNTTDSIVAAFFENNLTLRLDAKTKITLGNGQSPENIDLRIVQNSPPANKSTVIISPIYQISAGYDSSGNYQEVYFDHPVTITLRYDPAAIPQNATAVYIAYYEEKPGDPNPVWVRLDYPPDYVTESGQVSGLLSHLSLFVVIAELPTEAQSPLPPPLIPVILGAIGVVTPVSYVMMKRRKYRKLSHALANAVNTMAPTIEQLDLYTAKHQERVAELASAIAREMNLSEELVKMLLMVGIIQDTGTVETPYPVAQTAIQYNERLNGSGYPQKLAGDDILLEARILAVADTVETMSSPRPNRPAMSLAKALEEIKQNSRTLYDSEVVQALVRLVKRGNFGFKTSYDLSPKSEGAA